MSANDTTILLLCCVTIVLFFSLGTNAIIIPRDNTSRKKLKDAEARLKFATGSAQDAMLLQWLDELPCQHYRNEIEVEIKFIYPMLRFLGYEPDELQVRVPIPIQVGRLNQNTEADWLLLRNKQVFAVLEAKAVYVDLTEEVLAQARSYAYGLNINTYIVTNGRVFEVWSRTTQKDVLVLGFQVGEIRTHWEKLKNTIGKTKQ